MITSKTVFVLGAGASQPYGYPTGVELTEMVLKGVQDSAPLPHLHRLLLECDIDRETIREFRRALRLSARYSVDAFLEDRPEFMQVGKLATASTIISCESRKTLARPPGENWYRYLFNKMSARLGEYEQNDVMFLTFNYDRSLDYFMFDAIKHSYGLKDAETARMLESTPIVHLHGRVGYPTWQKGSFQRKYENSDSLQRDSIVSAAGEIKIIHEKFDDGGDFAVARSNLQSAKRVYFLGFGFHPINLDRLGMRQGTAKEASGTGLGMRTAEIMAIKRMMEGRIQITQLGCEDFLREAATLD